MSKTNVKHIHYYKSKWIILQRLQLDENKYGDNTTALHVIAVCIQCSIWLGRYLYWAKAVRKAAFLVHYPNLRIKVTKAYSNIIFSRCKFNINQLWNPNKKWLFHAWKGPFFLTNFSPSPVLSFIGHTLIHFSQHFCKILFPRQFRGRFM